MNWGFAAIPAAFAVGLVPVAVRGFLVYRHNNDLTPDLPGETAIARGLRVHGIANVAPRQAVDALRGRIAESDHRLLRRCDGAAANASEALPLFASAVVKPPPLPPRARATNASPMHDPVLRARQPTHSVHLSQRRHEQLRRRLFKFQ